MGYGNFYEWEVPITFIVPAIPGEDQESVAERVRAAMEKQPWPWEMDEPVFIIHSDPT